MKTYQFVTFAILLTLLFGAIAYNKRKKPCGCGGAHAAADTTTIETSTDNG